MAAGKKDNYYLELIIRTFLAHYSQLLLKIVPTMGAAMYEGLLGHAADPMPELLTGALGEPGVALYIR